MKNVPRIYLGENIESGTMIPAGREIVHYIKHVMRRSDFLGFGSGREFSAKISEDGRFIDIGVQTDHTDPSNDVTLLFAPVKRTDDLLNMATQLGVRAFQPVITEHTVTKHINWERMRKIVIEASEQSGRNSIPVILPEKNFLDVDLSNIVFADERCAYGAELPTYAVGAKYVFVGPEGGFSEKEFAAFDAAGAKGISLGKTILRAELAAAIAISRVIL